MYENKMMPHEEYLVNIFLDFIIVSANLAKKANHTIKQKQIKEASTSMPSTPTTARAPPVV